MWLRLRLESEALVVCLPLQDHAPNANTETCAGYAHERLPLHVRAGAEGTSVEEFVAQDHHPHDTRANEHAEWVTTVPPGCRPGRWWSQANNNISANVGVGCDVAKPDIPARH